MRFTEEGQGECLSDPERHMIVSAAWKKIGGFSALLLNDKDLTKQMERNIGSSMRVFGYRAGGAVKRTVGGRQAEGFCYTYIAQDTAMYGESLVLRSGKTLYYFHLYAREALKEDSLPVWEALLAGTEWVK